MHDYSEACMNYSVKMNSVDPPVLIQLSQEDIEIRKQFTMQFRLTADHTAHRSGTMPRRHT